MAETLLDTPRMSAPDASSLLNDQNFMTGTARTQRMTWFRHASEAMPSGAFVIEGAINVGLDNCKYLVHQSHMRHTCLITFA